MGARPTKRPRLLNHAADGDYLTHTPRWAERVWGPQDTLWPSKARRLGDWTRVQELDKHALNVPRTMKPPLTADKLTGVVKHLTSRCSTPTERLRVMVRWIADNVQYDTRHVGSAGDAAPGPDCSVAAVLRTGRAVCAGYAALLQECCRLADLECVSLVGLSKAAGYYPGSVNTDNPFTDHAWNMVKLGSKWFLMDATWVGGAVGIDEPHHYVKRWSEWWFLASPEQFRYMHLPVTDGRPDTAAQLLRHPHTTVKAWDRDIARDPAAVFFGIAPVSHKCAYVSTRRSEMKLTFTNPHHMTLLCKIKRTRIEGTSRYLSDLDSKYSTMVYTTEGRTRLRLRLPGKGSYQVRVLGQVVHATPELAEPGDTFRVATYVITNTDTAEPPHFPQAVNNTWGPTEAFTAAGFQFLSKNTVVRTSSGRCVVRIKLPSTKVFPQCFELTHCEYSGNRLAVTKLKDNVYGERIANQAVYHLYLPKVGEYKFDVNLRFKDTGSLQSGFTEGLSVLVKNKKECSKPVTIANSGTLCGPNIHFAKMGLLVGSSIGGSTLPVRLNGTAELSIVLTRPMGVHGSLHADGISMNDIVSYLTEEKKGEAKVTFRVTPKQPAVYMLHVYASEPGKTTRTLAGVWVIPYKKSL